MEAHSKVVFFFEDVTSQRNSDYHIMCASTSYMFSYELSWTIRAMYCKNICTWRADYDEDLVRRISQNYSGWCMILSDFILEPICFLKNLHLDLRNRGSGGVVIQDPY
jgi:hypothetical protein